MHIFTYLSLTELWTEKLSSAYSHLWAGRVSLLAAVLVSLRLETDVAECSGSAVLPCAAPCLAHWWCGRNKGWCVLWGLEGPSPVKSRNSQAALGCSSPESTCLAFLIYPNMSPGSQGTCLGKQKKIGFTCLLRCTLEISGDLPGKQENPLT